MAYREKLELLYIGGCEVLPEPLNAREEQACIEAMQDHQDKEAKEKLIAHNLRLVVYIAKKFDNTKVGTEDLISIGTIGLMKAINTFDASKSIKLATYASRCIENEILMYLRKNNKQKLEVSIDEPLNVDWDGNELLFVGYFRHGRGCDLPGFGDAGRSQTITSGLKDLKRQGEDDH